MSVPTGDALLGRIVDPLGNPIDEKGPLAINTYRMVEVLLLQLFRELLLICLWKLG
jgi:F0F1-type ATP synthase alpha subunit